MIVVDSYWMLFSLALAHKNAGAVPDQSETYLYHDNCPVFPWKSWMNLKGAGSRYQTLEFWQSLQHDSDCGWSIFQRTGWLGSHHGAGGYPWQHSGKTRRKCDAIIPKQCSSRICLPKYVLKSLEVQNVHQFYLRMTSHFTPNMPASCNSFLQKFNKDTVMKVLMLVFMVGVGIGMLLQHHSKKSWKFFREAHDARSTAEGRHQGPKVSS